MFTFNHFNFNVLDLNKSMEFYSKALGLKEVRRKEAPDGSWILVYLGDGKTGFTLELTWLRDRKEKYNLGECEFHLAFEAEDYEKAHEKHKEMGCIIFENPEMGIYFIGDPDGYWIEVIPPKNKLFLNSGGFENGKIKIIFGCGKPYESFKKSVYG